MMITLFCNQLIHFVLSAAAAGTNYPYRYVPGTWYLVPGTSRLFSKSGTLVQVLKYIFIRVM